MEPVLRVWGLGSCAFLPPGALPHAHCCPSAQVVMGDVGEEEAHVAVALYLLRGGR